MPALVDESAIESTHNNNANNNRLWNNEQIKQFLRITPKYKPKV